MIMRNPVGLFMPGGICMTPYPKKVLSIQQQYQTYIDAGMTKLPAASPLRKGWDCVKEQTGISRARYEILAAE